MRNRPRKTEDKLRGVKADLLATPEKELERQAFQKEAAARVKSKNGNSIMKENHDPDPGVAQGELPVQGEPSEDVEAARGSTGGRPDVREPTTRQRSPVVLSEARIAERQEMRGGDA
jgi:hypothetical protein